jgi:hypothetical protein
LPPERAHHDAFELLDLERLVQYRRVGDQRRAFKQISLTGHHDKGNVAQRELVGRRVDSRAAEVEIEQGAVDLIRPDRA